MNERKMKDSMIWNIPLPRQVTSVRRILLVFFLFALFFHYHLLRKLILLNIQKDDFKENHIHLLPQQYRRLHPPQFRNQTTRISNGNQTSSRFQTISSSRRIKVNLSDAPNRNWAYAFLVSGCSEEKPGYKGFLYNIVVSAKRLKEMGSVADIVVMIQMSESTDSRTIPLEEENMLIDNGIKIRYLPKMRSSYHECFYALVQEKFRILQLTEYSRVLFIDADIMPLCNLDYMFELSEPAEINKLSLLKENVIIAWRDEAANAGFFMMKPNNDDWKQLQREIRRKEEKALSLPWPYWDKVEGWGHKIMPPDYWRPLNGTKLTAWDWHAVFADQGLLYYYTKYVKKNVSIIIGPEIEQWSSKDGGDVNLEKIDSNPFGAYSCFPLGQMAAPYRDYFHFTGRAKPWECNLRTNITVGVQIRSDGSEFEINRRQAEKINQWRSILLQVQKDTTTYNFTLSWSEQQSEPPLGRFSTYPHMSRHIKLKKFHKWNHYEDEPPIASKKIE